MYRVFTIQCDVSNDSRVVSPLNARTLDSNSNKIRVKFVRDFSDPYSLYDGMTLTVRFKLSNGSLLEQTITITGDLAESLIRNDVFNIEGKVEVELKVGDGAGFEITASHNVFFDVVKVLEGEDVPPNTSFVLNDITDVSIANAQNGDFLIFENGEWINKAIAIGGGGSVVTTSDTDPLTSDYWFDIET